MMAEMVVCSSAAQAFNFAASRTGSPNVMTDPDQHCVADQFAPWGIVVADTRQDTAKRLFDCELR